MYQPAPVSPIAPLPLPTISKHCVTSLSFLLRIILSPSEVTRCRTRMIDRAEVHFALAL